MCVHSLSVVVLQDSLPVVLRRFSDGVEVVRCVMDFCNVSYMYFSVLPTRLFCLLV